MSVDRDLNLSDESATPNAPEGLSHKFALE